MEKKDQKVADNLLKDINTVISELEEAEMEKEASILHDIFVRLAKLPEEKETGHKSAPKGYPEKAKLYADPENFKYPIDTEEHARAAWSYIHQERNRKQYTPAEFNAICARIKKAGKKIGIDFADEK